MEKEKSFSDWSIIINTPDAPTEPKEFHVHRHVLATGPKKSGYFERIFGSPDESELIYVPKDVSQIFPTFLDYLYAPISECKCVITSGNALKLRYLSDRFQVPSLRSALNEFILDDMKNLERTEDYLKRAIAENDKELIACASRVCIENVLHLRAHPSLLFSMPPALFLHVFAYANQYFNKHIYSRGFVTDEPVFRVFEVLNQLAITYIKHHRDRLSLKYFYSVFDEVIMPEDCEFTFPIIRKYIALLEEIRWDGTWAPSPYYYQCERFEQCCIDVVYEYTTKCDLSESEMSKIMLSLPHNATSQSKTFETRGNNMMCTK